MGTIKNNMETIRITANDKVTFIPPESVRINDVLYKIISVDSAVNRTEEWDRTSYHASYTFNVERIDNILHITKKRVSNGINYSKSEGCYVK